jgi:mitogen-activated protein kinase kinase
MLEHPWMMDMRNKRVNMSRYLSQVWGWEDVSGSQGADADAAAET